MKKIILIGSLGLGGAERVISRLCHSNNFIDVNLVTFNPYEFYYFDNPTLCLKNWFSRIFYFLKLDNHATVQAHLNIAILFIGLIGVFKRFKIQAVHCFSYSAFYKKKGFVGSLHKYLFSRLLKRFDLHIFKAEEMILDFKNTFGWVPKNYTIINNPYDMSEIKALSTINENNIEIDRNLNNIAIVGRLVSSKRPFDVINIANQLSHNTVFHIIGDGPMYDDLINYVNKLNLNNVIFYGSLENPFHILSKCDYYLSCSEAEGFPNALVEALIFGLIPIHSLCLTGPAEIISDNCNIKTFNNDSFHKGVRGYLFKTGDISGACSAFNHAFAYKNIIHSDFSKSANEYVSNLSVNKISKKYYNCFKGIYESV